MAVQDEWCDANPTNYEQWEDGKFTASERRILFSHWYAEAVERVNKNVDALEKYMGHAGLLMTADGSDDDKIKLEGFPKDRKYSFMHSNPDKWLAECAQEPAEPEPEPEGELEGEEREGDKFTYEELEALEELEAELNMDVPEFEDLADQAESCKSGDLPQVPTGFAAAPACPKMTKALLLKKLIMYDHDSGWEQGEIMVVTGRGAAEKSCVVVFELLPSEKVTLQLSKDTYCSENDFSKGKWFMLAQTKDQ